MLDELMATHEAVTSAQADKLNVSHCDTKRIIFIIIVTEERKEIFDQQANKY